MYNCILVLLYIFLDSWVKLFYRNSILKHHHMYHIFLLFLEHKFMDLFISYIKSTSLYIVVCLHTDFEFWLSWVKHWRHLTSVQSTSRLSSIVVDIIEYLKTNVYFLKNNNKLILNFKHLQKTLVFFNISVCI